MIKINIYCVGSLKENYLKEASDEYLKRLSRYAKVSIIEVNEAKINSFDNISLIEKTLDEEGKNLLARIKDEEYLVLLDLHGKEYTSEELAFSFNNLVSKGTSSFALVIGGTLGLSDELRKKARAKISLSKMTFPHQLTRIILLEQLYRIFKINNHESYHH
jgi:23S rRNA (pseudouridine1915-N3)-methyltransferase